MKNTEIKGDTKLTGLIGNPVGHSISPIIHNHAFAELALNYSYIPLGIEPKNLGGLVSTLRALKFSGANVTIPYKSDIIQYCDEIDDLSKLTGTVNTLFMKNDKLCGTTTDAIGFLKALKSDNISTENSNISILGNGGTSRTIAMVLAYKNEVSSITIIGRNSEKLKVLTEEIDKKTGYAIGYSLFSDEKTDNILQNSDIIVNCTSVGMHPNNDISPLKKSQLSPDNYIFDVIYNPSKTLLLSYAEEVGCRFQNGLKMLLFQGLESFKYWTGKEVDDKIFNLDELQSMIESK